jgi:hypothetical protein
LYTAVKLFRLLGLEVSELCFVVGSQLHGHCYFLRCLLFSFINEILLLHRRYTVHAHQGNKRSNCPFSPLIRFVFLRGWQSSYPFLWQSTYELTLPCRLLYY